jgi:predicted metal-dependent HD superfamily phosphohydrolase
MMSLPTRERWLALAAPFGAVDTNDWYERLMTAYAETQRHYHNGQHITECLREFDRVRATTGNPALVELAIWFHDAVYNPRAHDNEERSADLAVQFLLGHSASTDLCEIVNVLATKHHVARTPDEAMLIDVDLSILGQPLERFAEYEQQIRREYEWVEANVFAQKRAEILRRFLERPRIYSTEHFFARYDTRARENLRWSLAQLSHGHL